MLFNQIRAGWHWLIGTPEPATFGKRYAPWRGVVDDEPQDLDTYAPKERRMPDRYDDENDRLAEQEERLRTAIAERRPPKPQIEEAILPFVPPQMSDAIPAAYRDIASEVVMAVSAMILKCENARQIAVQFVKECDKQGAWHNDFMAGYVTRETETIEALSAQWQKALDDLVAKREAAQPKQEEKAP